VAEQLALGAPASGWRVLLDDAARDCRVRYWPGWLPRQEADGLLSRALASPLPQPEVYGQGAQQVQTHRKSCAFGIPGLRYRYAGQVRQTHPWPRGFPEVAARVGEASDATYNFCLLQFYPDGRAQLGWHRDGEADLVPGATIASLSLGSARDFQMRWGNEGPATLSVPLGHGDLLVMEGRCQELTQHQVPVRRSVTGPRVNLTFRRVHG